MASFKYKKIHTSCGPIRLNQISNFLLLRIATGDMKLKSRVSKEQKPFKGVRGYEKMFREQAKMILERRGVPLELATT